MKIRIVAFFLLSLFLCGFRCLDVLEAIWGNKAAISTQFAQNFLRLDPKGGPGFVDIDTSVLFPKEFATDLHGKLVKRFAALDKKVFEVSGTPSKRSAVSLTEALTINGVVLVEPTEAQMCWEFANHIIEAMNNNPWGEKFGIDGLNLRIGTKEDVLKTGNDPHPDGSYMTVSTTLLGTGTAYQLPDGKHTTPTGHTLIFNGEGRTRSHPKQLPLVHWASAIAEDRVVLLIRIKRVY